MDTAILHQRIRRLSDEIESELTKLNRWQTIALPVSKLENIGRYGVNTMTFEQWIQFVLLPEIARTIELKEEFTHESTLAAYALYTRGEDDSSKNLVMLLAKLDDAINWNQGPPIEEINSGRPMLASVHSLPLPRELYDVSRDLPGFEGEALEMQLQKFDLFLESADTFEREIIADMLFEASSRATPANKRLRIRKAALAVKKGANTRVD